MTVMKFDILRSYTTNWLIVFVAIVVALLPDHNLLSL